MDTARTVLSSPQAALPAAAAPASRPGAPTLKEAATDFAAIFCQTLLKHAWKAEGFLSGGREAQAFYDQLSWEYARLLVQRTDGGIADMIVKSISPTERKVETGDGTHG